MKLMSSDLTAAYRYCQEITENHAENFPVASLLLPRGARRHLYAVYAFARTADDLADLSGHDTAGKLRLLDDWSKRLENATNGTPDHPIFKALAHTLATTELPVQLCHDLLTAFRTDVVKKRYADLKELHDYCRYSANPVGRIVLHLFGAADPENLHYSDSICTALQLVNHWQDLGRDVWSGRPLYLPQQELTRFGVREEHILSRGFSAATGDLMLYLVEHTRQQFHEGAPLIYRLEWPLNFEIAITWEAGMALLDTIEGMGGNTLRARPKLSGGDWMRCIWRALRRIRE